MRIDDDGGDGSGSDGSSGGNSGGGGDSGESEAPRYEGFCIDLLGELAKVGKTSSVWRRANLGARI